MMTKYTILFLVIVCLCLSKEVVSDLPDSSAPTRYTITHEAVFDIVIKDHIHANEILSKGRVVIGLFGNIVPMTVLNFITITNGIVRSNINFTYSGVPFHRIVKDFCIQTGDFINRDGTGSLSIYGPKFVDENFRLSHRSAGWVSMANYGKDTNGSQWFVTLVPARWLDGHHVVFGRVLQGIDFIHEIGEVETFPDTSLPKRYVGIINGSAKEVTRYDLALEDLMSSEDIIVA
ncbi:unnamed protein product [Rotaria sp. Silwood2]|nr:unnamed protein product [Rotaria sp. Silwood2]CAF2625210.1 unnamed protein product [Rotaria sp. Silwood2]CAF3016960.1 unnamed protein product [Rotaria sp. Silwood2]CAF4329971.1 unnamed protein product [Rotaria sp. Silwood2]CAF4586190.1 unnamed protein product [Rotaria sp. Silwood2]